MKLHFLGANRQVTGSCYMLEVAEKRLMIDCGMFQERAFLERNWKPLPITPASLSGVLLSHGHLDHVGLLPKLVREGFKQRIVATPATNDLTRIILQDAARIQEEDAAYKAKRHKRENRKGPHPIRPLYTPADADRVLPLLTDVPYGIPIDLEELPITVTFHDAGHILGSAILQLDIQDGATQHRIVFTGDLGPYDKILMHDPTPITKADTLIMESTYAQRTHCDEMPVDQALEQAITEAIADGGNVVIPTFAVERAQELLYYLGKLFHEKRLPRLPVFIDSPMAINVTELFHRYRTLLDADTQDMIQRGMDPLQFEQLHLTRTVEQSKAINAIKGTAVILAGSGMCTGGRIKHHLIANIERSESTILFVGYQAHGTLGRQIVDGEPLVRIFGHKRPVRAKIREIHGLSAHADHDDLLRWLDKFDLWPQRVFLTHGEENDALRFAHELTETRGLNVQVPHYAQAVEI